MSFDNLHLDGHLKLQLHTRSFVWGVIYFIYGTNEILCLRCDLFYLWYKRDPMFVVWSILSMVQHCCTAYRAVNRKTKKKQWSRGSDNCRIINDSVSSSFYIYNLICKKDFQYLSRLILTFFCLNIQIFNFTQVNETKVIKKSVIDSYSYFYHFYNCIFFW